MTNSANLAIVGIKRSVDGENFPKGIFPKKDIYEESDAISDVQVPIHRSAHVTATDL